MRGLLVVTGIWQVTSLVSNFVLPLEDYHDYYMLPVSEDYHADYYMLLVNGDYALRVGEDTEVFSNSRRALFSSCNSFN